MIEGLTPADVGLPPKFAVWRRGQTLALKRSLDCDSRFIAHSMPVGEGKSAYYIAHALLGANRTCVLTSSKGLQSQLMKDFSSIGLVDMRGRNNYTCQHKDAQTCEDGQHFRCPASVCPYEIHREAAMASSLVVTNYTYFMLSYIHGRGLGDFDLLILDEAHDSPDEVCAAMAVDWHYFEASLLNSRLPSNDSIDAWVEWAIDLLPMASDKLAELEEVAQAEWETNRRVHPATSREKSKWTKLLNKLQATSSIRGEWISDRTGDGYKLEPVWASDYASLILFRSIPKIVLVSATMVRKTLDLLGVSKDESSFYEYPSSFPPSRSPVYLYGPCQIDHRTHPANLTVWLSRIDNIIRRRKDRKGIIHTVSYDRARLIGDNSEFSAFMIIPAKGRETIPSIEKFKASLPPMLLVSPAITTGYDFPYDSCEYNLIIKVPFLDTRAKVIAARVKKDPEYGSYVTAQTIVQAHGRAMRAEDDSCETFILDKHMDWFIKKFRSLFPFWFHLLVSYPSTLPEPPAPLPRRAVPTNPLTQALTEDLTEKDPF